MIDRRMFLKTALAAPLAFGASRRVKMGVATTSYMTVRRPSDTLEFLEYVNTLGAGGIQAPLKSLEPDYARALRKRADELGMYVEVMAPLPRESSEAFEKAVAAARNAGARCLRCGCLSGRRYETFSTFAEWNDWVQKQRASILTAVSIVEKQKIPLALENHKDWTSDEMVKMLRGVSSEYLGVCLDTGNNIALLEDPMQVVEALAPFAITTHLKDMAVRSIPEGFELSEVPFGEGMLDIGKVIAAVRAKRPQVGLTLEMITRDPLKVPCMTQKYWATFPDRSGWVLARALQMAQGEGERKVPRLTGLDRAAQLKAEDDNVRRCIEYAREKLTLI